MNGHRGAVAALRLREIAQQVAARSGRLESVVLDELVVFIDDWQRLSEADKAIMRRLFMRLRSRDLALSREGGEG